MDRQMDSWTDTQEQICRHGGIKCKSMGPTIPLDNLDV